MCGLVVTASFQGAPADPALLKRASDALEHRGPDDSGLTLYGSVGFAFRRLAILDLSPAGHQPMELPDDELAIVFNGEIYNYVELKRELQQLGRRFRSSSDTEVLLHAYAVWGPDCVQRLNGMWAFVIYDRRRRLLFASRDRFGVKPLYMWRDAGRLILASEIKAIVASGWYRPAVNWGTAARFLIEGHLDQDANTFFEGIEQLPAGSTLEIAADGTTKQRRFWSLDNLASGPPSDPVAAFRELFEDSVRLRMRSDVPVGICLSGGIDSNAIISMMAKLRTGQGGAPLEAFSYIPEEFSEAEYINETVATTGAVLNTLQTNPRELWDLLPKALWHYDEPAHSPTALIGFQLMRLAKSRGITVVLNGQGADEVNAGYHVYFRPFWSELLHAGKWRRAFSEMSRYATVAGIPRRPLISSTIGHWLRSELRDGSGYPDEGRMRRTQKAGWYTGGLVGRLPAVTPRPSGKSLRATLVRSVERRPLPLYLRVEDRNSMAHSVEARLPFLDYRLVSLAFSLPSEWKLKGEWNKYLVRASMKGTIPERVRTRFDKMGFPTPDKRWLADAWYEPARDLLSTKTLRDAGICDLDAVRRDLDRHRTGAVDVSRKAFHLAQFSLWLDQNLRAPASASSAVPSAPAAVNVT